MADRRPLPRVLRRLLVLVHGYNNDEQDAHRAYDSFLDHLGELPWLRDAWPVLLFTWPGDKWGTLGYPLSVLEAEPAAIDLARVLRQLRGPDSHPAEVVLVAHSLGTRVALEVARILDGDRPRGVAIAGACLMASAVPTEFVEVGGRLRRAAEGIAKTLVLFSTQDSVLRRWFQLGQYAAERTHTPAVGRFGSPAGLWHLRRDFSLLGYDHGHYWPSSMPSRLVAAYLMGKAVPNRLAALRLPSQRLPHIRIGEHAVPTRRLAFAAR